MLKDEKKRQLMSVNRLINQSERQERFEREDEAVIRTRVKLPYINAILPQTVRFKTTPRAVCKQTS